MFCLRSLSTSIARRQVLYLMALAVTLATCAQLPEDNGPPRNCLSTQAGQTELRDLLTTVLRNKSIIFPTGANGIIDGGLFEPDLRQHMEEQSYYDWGQHHKLRHHRHHRGHHFRRHTRSASDCRADRVCTAVFQLEEDSTRIPRYLLKATCADCSRCSNLGGTCQPILYQLTVFKDCTNLLTDCQSCRAHQQSVPVGCTCILDTLSKRR